MKKFVVLFLATFLWNLCIVAQTKYLVNLYKPVDSYRYTEYKYTGSGSRQIAMSGGLKWYGGFTIGCTSAPYKPGNATFKLGGK